MVQVTKKQILKEHFYMPPYLVFLCIRSKNLILNADQKSDHYLYNVRHNGRCKILVICQKSSIKICRPLFHIFFLVNCTS